MNELLKIKTKNNLELRIKTDLISMGYTTYREVASVFLTNWVEGLGKGDYAYLKTDKEIIKYYLDYQDDFSTWCEIIEKPSNGIDAERINKQIKILVFIAICRIIQNFNEAEVIEK
jgi:hypothetical protein